MIQVRRSNDRGHADFGWLDTRHTFSFGSYYDPRHMGFRALRVINEDYIAPSRGFGAHPHQNMEIVTFVLEGAIEHRDSLGNGSVIRPGEIQRMSAGTGIVHSEFNPSDQETMHLLQIWIQTEKDGVAPEYEQRSYAERVAPNALTLLASRDGEGGAVRVRQDARMHLATLEPGGTIDFRPAAGRHAWIQAIRGGLRVNGEALAAGDGLSASGEARLLLEADGAAEALVFDLA